MRYLAALVAIATAALSGIAVAATETRNPCQLVTTADVKQILGNPIGPPKAQTLGLYHSCTYVTTGKTLTVQTRQIAKADFDKSAKMNPGPVVKVSGLGADAYFAGRAVLLVWKKGTEVTFLAIGVPNTLAVEKKLALRALKRI